jgi:hypothetical protein
MFILIVCMVEVFKLVGLRFMVRFVNCNDVI